MSARLRLMLSIAALLVVLAIGTAGYMVLESDRGVTFRDAAYMTVITLSTVGYNEPWELSPEARSWTVGVIAFGIATVTYAFGSIISLVVGGELRSHQEQRRLKMLIDRLSDHVILCGYGRMGVLIAQELHSRSLPLVVVESDPEIESTLGKLGPPYIIGSATDDDVLEKAGIMRARALVIALPSDADNVFLTLTARHHRRDLTIIARAEQPSTEATLLRAGATRVVCPQATGAMKVANILTRPNVVDFVELASKGVELEIDEYVVEAKSPLSGKSLREADMRAKTGAVAVAIKRANGQAIVNPDPDAVLEPGDTLILVGPAGVSSRLKELGKV